MKGYKNLAELKKEWASHGVQVNEKGELFFHHQGQEYKIGQASFFDENGRSVSQEELKNEEKHVNDTERERDDLSRRQKGSLTEQKNNKLKK